MTTIVWFRSHVERLLQEIWDCHDLVTDSDDDYPFRVGTAAAWVVIEDGNPMAVRVFAHAAYGFKETVALLREVNDLNGRSRFTSVGVRGGTVICEYAVPAAAVTEESLHLALSTVGGQAADVGPMLATVFGGSTPYEDEPCGSDADQDVA